MPDVVDAATRSRMMAGIRGRDTKPEIALRKALFARGFRYRLHVPDLPGKPDIVLPRYRATIFVNGCFWHGHDCPLFRLPGTRPDFWRAKIARNRQRDAEVSDRIAAAGWRQLVVWECALTGRLRLGLETVAESVSVWLRSAEAQGVIRGMQECQ